MTIDMKKLLERLNSIEEGMYDEGPEDYDAFMSGYDAGYEDCEQEISDRAEEAYRVFKKSSIY